LLHEQLFPIRTAIAQEQLPLQIADCGMGQQKAAVEEYFAAAYC
jgi:hypothetical protein